MAGGTEKVIYRAFVVIVWILAIGYIVSVSALSVVTFHVIREEFFKERQKNEQKHHAGK